MNSLPYRNNVCMLIFNKDKRLFLGERKGEPGVYQLPQGGVEEGSSLEASVLREVHEELGVALDKIRVIKKLKSTHKYDFSVTPAPYQGIYRGQTQTFWIVEFLGEDSDIDLFKNEPELSSYRWCTPDEILRLAEPKRLAGYIEPLREFEMFIKAKGLTPSHK